MNTNLIRPISILVTAGVLMLFGTSTHAQDYNSQHCAELPFVYNVFWTTKYGPAGADVQTATSNMLACSGPQYAMCDYSGPEPLPCKIDPERGVAVCECYAMEPKDEPYHYFVNINAIRNACTYIETVRDCGHDGSGCASQNSAPVCNDLAQRPQSLMPNADLVATLGLFDLPEYGKPGTTECDGLYAGCMTAPCRTTQNENRDTVAICECPLHEGPYQVSQDGASCFLETGLVWSATYKSY